MIAVAIFQALLDGLGSILAFLYNLIPNYGVAIILFTLGIRVLLLPLGIKQVRSMHAMQAIQPKVKELQKKYKGNRQKLNEEMMALYRERGVNPLSGCLPVLAQFPVLIALFAVLNVRGGDVQHIPTDSRLYGAIVRQDTNFVGANLLCNATSAGREVPVERAQGQPPPDIRKPLDCGAGQGLPIRIPYYLLAVAMIGTTYYQQRQMQRASPPGASAQTQALTKVMPLLFGIWGFIFPAGLVLYWTTTNLVQIGQQHFLLPKRDEVIETNGKKQSSTGAKPAAKALRPARSASGGGARALGATERKGGATAKGPTSKGSTAKPRDQGNKGNTGGAAGGDRKKRRKR